MSLPYYSMYPKDFDANENVRLMNDDEMGMFLRFLNHAWPNDGLPGDPEDIRRMFRYPVEEFNAKWPRVGREFPLDQDGRRRNPRQEKERTIALRKTARTEAANRSKGQKSRLRDVNVHDNVDDNVHVNRAERGVRASDSDSVSGSESVERNSETSLPENPPALRPDVGAAPEGVVSADPFEIAGFSGEFELRLWFEDLVKRHPNKSKNRLAHSKLREEVLEFRFNRQAFDSWYESALLNPRWHEAGGHFAPNLFSILEDCLWRHAPPDFTNPSNLEPKRKSLMDQV